MKIAILFGRKSEIAEVNLHQIIAKLDIGIMLMTDCLNDQFVQDIYDIGQLGGEVANVLIVTDDPRITLASLDRLQTNFRLINHVFDAQSLLRPVRPFNNPERFVVEPGGRGANKQPFRPMRLPDLAEETIQAHRALEWKNRWDETTRQMIEDEKAGRSIPYISVGYRGSLSERDGQQVFDIEGLVDPLPRLGMPSLDSDSIRRNIERMALDDQRLFGTTKKSLRDDVEYDMQAYYALMSSLLPADLTVAYKADNFIPDPAILSAAERDYPLTTGLKTMSDELRIQHSPMPLGDGANYTTARPTWGKATKQQILADLESIKRTLDSD